MSLYAGRKPELTDERREKIVAWYEENVAAMMAELEAWYPDKVIYSNVVMANHRSFVDRVAAVANELGYRKWPRLAAAYGFDTGNGTVAKIDIGYDVDLIADGVWEKIADTYIPGINEWYPDGIVSDFRKSHPKTAEKLVKLAKKFGYETCAELLVACGYDVRDSYSVKGGRPTSFDPEAVLAELKERFAEHPASSVDQVKDLCGDLPIKTFMNTCKSTYGVTFSQLLAQEGVLGGSAVVYRSDVSFSDEELVEAVRQMEAKYADSEHKPLTLKDLIGLNPDFAPQLSAAQKESPRLFGNTFVRHLKSQGVLASPKAKPAKIDDATCQGIVDAMCEKYLRTIRPNSLSELKNQNPEYVKAHSSVDAWIKRVYGQTPSDFFKAKELVSKVSRPDSILRPSEDEIRAFYDEIGLDDARAVISRLPEQDVVEFDSDVTGSEEYDNVQSYEMLRVGDVITFELIDDQYVGGIFCGQKFGLINHEDRISRKLSDVVAYADAMGVVGGHMYAEVLEVAGGQKRPKALIKVFYGIDEARSNCVDDMLLSGDGKTVYKYLGDGGRVIIPEGVEVIAPSAFFEAPVTSVEFPQTLREIGERAFALCACRNYNLPASVERIGDGAFSFCFGELLEYQDIAACGPVNVWVDGGNSRFSSVDGSLIELDGEEKRLLSLHYDGAPGRPYDWEDIPNRPLAITVPDGTTVLASRCVSAAKDFKFALKFPSSLWKIEKNAFVTEYEHSFTRMRVVSVNIPAGLTEIDHTFWGNCAEDIPHIYDQTGNPRSEIGLRCSIKIEPGNPRYSIQYNRLLINLFNKTTTSDSLGLRRSQDIKVDRLPDNLIFPGCMSRLSEDEVELGRESIVGDYVSCRRLSGLSSSPKLSGIPNLEKSADGNVACVSFGGRLMPLDDKLNWGVLQNGDVLGLATSESYVVPVASLFGREIALVDYDIPHNFNPFEFHPTLSSPIEGELGLIGRSRFAYVDETTGENLSYEFLFTDDHSDKDEIAFIEREIEHYTLDNLLSEETHGFSPELRLREEFNRSLREPEKTRPSLVDVINRYEELGGVGRPHAVLIGFCCNADETAVLFAHVQIRMAFDLGAIFHEN